MDLWKVAVELVQNQYLIDRVEVSEKQLKKLRKSGKVNKPGTPHESYDDAVAEMHHRRQCDIDRAEALLKQAQSYRDYVRASEAFPEKRG